MKYLIINGNSVFAEPLISEIVKNDSSSYIVCTYDCESYSENKYVDETLNMDIDNFNEVNNTIQLVKADYIFDFEVKDSVSHSWNDPVSIIDTNVIGLINVLNAVRDYSPKSRLVLTGSGEEFGGITFDKQPIAEMETPRPINIFGASKVSQSMLVSLYSKGYDLDIIILRTFNEISDKQDERFAISYFCKQFVLMQNNLIPKVLKVGNINNYRDFTDVNDLARAFYMVALKGKRGETYNAARGKGYSLKEVISVIEHMTNIQVTIEIDRERVRPIDSPSIIANVEKIRTQIGWVAMIPLEDTINRILKKWTEVVKI